MVIEEPATGPYLEPDESSRPISLGTSSILSSRLTLGLPIGLCIRRFPTKMLVETERKTSLGFSQIIKVGFFPLYDSPNILTSI